MNTIDLVILTLALVGAFGGYREGFLMELISLGSIVFGIFCGFKLMGQMVLFLENQFDINRSILPYVAFIVVFVLVVLLVRLLGRMVKGSIDKTLLGSADQAMGALLGGFKTLFMLSVVLWILDSLRISPRSSWTEGSWLYEFTASLAPTIGGWLGELLPVFSDIFREF